MKKGNILIGIVIATIGFTVFGFINQREDIKTRNVNMHCAPSNQADTGMKYWVAEKAEMNLPPFIKDLPYIVRAKYARTITMEKLKKANSLSDLIPYYPVNWIDEYISVEISSSCNDKNSKAVGPNDVLSEEQKYIFSSIDLTADINITVRYKNINPVTDEFENHEMITYMAVVPETEAEYYGGYDQMIQYLKENSLEEIHNRNTQMLPFSRLLFTVNEQGNTENIKVVKTSGDLGVDKILIDLISNMPKWKPAENYNGINVKQEFEFVVGRAMDGC